VKSHTVWLYYTLQGGDWTFFWITYYCPIMRYNIFCMVVSLYSWNFTCNLKYVMLCCTYTPSWLEFLMINYYEFPHWAGSWIHQWDFWSNSCSQTVFLSVSYQVTQYLHTLHIHSKWVSRSMDRKTILETWQLNCSHTLEFCLISCLQRSPRCEELKVYSNPYEFHKCCLILEKGPTDSLAVVQAILVYLRRCSLQG